ncbi:hypothetical protein B484DRAFT_167264 [Ochromonadaceae sp. CCMP2298]|nr:hypothetical protein B484DRAFT_167264 [Ochromonadaceae sp. CCMP2298]|mmetsp:Transcript_31539/g.69495  ORF Transcript_31539/g.69495 Transcript_31539/m.69495 type:complete len:282 (-) Transcript_31539:183-1028(-)|eukprot:CAMPEP_0173201126 /NCGR_PEP_ID=MMETSP1141-20130122/18175_1 /TAXON_ID=483371 /ORGANISM="non described non described, Strain CCMP2298" /LENGTH=281 /DNA_ID=CAMNT_0014126207 /DNA_START=44 /DNA_END=889 /DNA_ORIENTATION=+
MSEQNSTEEIPFAEEIVKRADDGFLAVCILIGAVLIVVGSVVYFWKNKKFSSADNSWKQNAFSPPPERLAYIEAKETLDPTNVSDLDELKKLLMRRAIQTIPIVLSLQNEGSSIERLYKRGMLTDDMHFKVKELKAFVDQEFQDIQFAADDLVEGWGQHIWPQAMQFHQMIQKQAESRGDEARALEEDKKKSESQKKKDKERAKKTKSKDSKDEVTTTSTPSQASSSGASSSSAAIATPPPAPVLIPLDTEASKAQEAERMAQLLLEEEDLERKKGKKGKK